jgi:hypothetical protein
MPTEILKRPMEHSILMSFLSHVSSLDKNEFLVNYDTLKRAKYNDNELLNSFLEEIRPYYYISKRTYLDEPITYRRFLTIIRQICNYNHIPYRSTLKYEHSKQKVEYYVSNTLIQIEDTDNTHCEKETCGSSDLDDDA